MRLVVPLIRQHGHQVEPGEDAGRERRINASCDHHLLTTQRDVLCGVGNRIRRTRAACRDYVREAAKSEGH